jgi:ATP-dependent phosphoenolpyruvate carboxykinase
MKRDASALNFILPVLKNLYQCTVVQMWEMRYSHFLWFVKVGKTTLSADPKRN